MSHLVWTSISQEITFRKNIMYLIIRTQKVEKEKYTHSVPNTHERIRHTDS